MGPDAYRERPEMEQLAKTMAAVAKYVERPGSGAPALPIADADDYPDFENAMR